ncbi:MAG: dihydroorotate dehydrogenase [Thermoguttaceae bacterium]|nr:dihydroorotate dehydrogenase [Thermoguttaceae bacterium]
MKDLSVTIGSVTLNNPVMTASGAFGNVKEATDLVDVSKLGAVVPKTITRAPRQGNAPPRTVETTAGLLNAIGLDNDGLESFLTSKLPYYQSLPCPVVISFAGENADDYVSMAQSLEIACKSCELRVASCELDNRQEARGKSEESSTAYCLLPTACKSIVAFEMNISCPNVAHGTDFGKDPALCEKLVSSVRKAISMPLFVKLTPNVSDITVIAKAAQNGGADAVCLINTVLGMAIDWKNRRPRLGNRMGGLSGPAIKPIALRMVYQVAHAVTIPVIGIGGIETIDDAMEFLVAGATAFEVGTANFYRPTATMEIVDALPAALDVLGANSVKEIIGSCE